MGENELKLVWPVPPNCVLSVPLLLKRLSRICQLLLMAVAQPVSPEAGWQSCRIGVVVPKGVQTTAPLRYTRTASDSTTTRQPITMTRRRLFVWVLLADDAIRIPPRS